MALRKVLFKGILLTSLGNNQGNDVYSAKTYALDVWWLHR
jgi:hypothetical protein